MKGSCGLDQQLERWISSSLALLGCTRASTKLVGRVSSPGSWILWEAAGETGVGAIRHEHAH